MFCIWSATRLAALDWCMVSCHRLWLLDVPFGLIGCDRFTCQYAFCSMWSCVLLSWLASWPMFKHFIVCKSTHTHDRDLWLLDMLLYSFPWIMIGGLLCYTRGVQVLVMCSWWMVFEQGKNDQNWNCEAAWQMVHQRLRWILWRLEKRVQVFRIRI